MESLQFLAFASLTVLVPLLSFFFLTRKSKPQKQSPPSPSTITTQLPKSYPLIGSFFAVYANRKRRMQWMTDVLKSSPSATYAIRRSFNSYQVITANPVVVQHILKTPFHNYGKGGNSHRVLKDLLGFGIFNVDGESWKFQRQVSSHEYNSKSLRKFVETVVDTELSERLIPILSSAAAKTGTVLDFQDILQRFAFDNICKIAFGFDPAYLLPSLPQAKFAEAFEESVKISTERLISLIPLVWKIKKMLILGPRNV